ncbi:MAG TPA: hypothetical protein PLA69_06380, partial [Flavobacterium sp.]|nr:hypothetical protein [Flavobacterium sp.]
HHVIVVDDCQAIDVQAQGSAVRYGGLYGEAGANVNFVTPLSPDRFKVRTYERGVEDETLSCGTGVTAVALCMYQSGKTLARGRRRRTRGFIYAQTGRFYPCLSFRSGGVCL